MKIASGAMQGPPMQPTGYAAGGQVQDEMGALGGPLGVPVGGKMVIDPDPQAPTDFIPAMVDGVQPARLDSGEFVIPKDVVSYYGTKFLTDLIRKANPDNGAAAQPA